MPTVFKPGKMVSKTKVCRCGNHFPLPINCLWPLYGRALKMGYNVLLEKWSPLLKRECRDIWETPENRKVVAVCHVLRFSLFYKTTYWTYAGGAIEGGSSSLPAYGTYWAYSHGTFYGVTGITAPLLPLLLAKSYPTSTLNGLTGQESQSATGFGVWKWFT